MGAHVLLNLLNELGKGDKMRGLSSILSLFNNEFNKFNTTGARKIDSIYHMTYFFCGSFVFLCLVFLMLSRLFIVALWSPTGKGLTIWLLLVMFIIGTSLKC